MAEFSPHPASFKDPDGFVYTHQGKIYRQVNKSYTADYDLLMNSGLYQDLISRQLMLSHVEINEPVLEPAIWYKTILPEQLPIISYPYEWCFGQLKEAALLTLAVMETSMKHGMILKDASAYNIQFLRGKAVFIDTLSFESYDQSRPWVAYRQFCQHFLFPLYIEHYSGPGTIKMLSNYLDGIPASLTASWLPWKSKFNLGVRLHVMLQANIKGEKKDGSGYQFNKQKLERLIQHLKEIITGLKSPSGTTTWSNYYAQTILSQEYLAQKEKLFRQFLDSISGQQALDLGANDGHFSAILAEKFSEVVATDFDSACIDNLYSKTKGKTGSSILPLVLDISNPSASIGFNNKERSAFPERIHPELVTALALIHHLAIGKNIPLNALADYFAGLGPQLIIEFVPKEDEKAKQLLSGRKDVFHNYHQDGFEKAFSQKFQIQKSEPIPGTQRRLYLMKTK